MLTYTNGSFIVRSSSLFSIDMGTFNRKYCLLLVPVLLAFAGFLCTETYSWPIEDSRYFERQYVSPGAHQLASWLTSQLRRSDFLPIPHPEVPISPYRLPLQGKRNSEVTNAIIGSEETQKMYRDGR